MTDARPIYSRAWDAITKAWAEVKNDWDRYQRSMTPTERAAMNKAMADAQAQQMEMAKRAAIAKAKGKQP